MKYYYGSSNLVFSKGIRVAELDKPSYFTLDAIEGLVLTEDRTMKSESELKNNILYDIMRSTDTSFIELMITIPKLYYEHDLDYSIWHSTSEQFDETVAACIKDKTKIVTPNIQFWWDAKQEIETKQAEAETKIEINLEVTLTETITKDEVETVIEEALDEADLEYTFS